MHASSRLASSLKPRAPWLDAPRHALTRVARFTRRIVTPVIDLDIPRGAGAAGAALIMLGSIGYGVSAGGHLSEIATDLRRACDAVSNGAGLRITSITLENEHEIGRTNILTLIDIKNTSSLLCLNTASTRSTL